MSENADRNGSGEPCPYCATPMVNSGPPIGEDYCPNKACTGHRDDFLAEVRESFQRKQRLDRAAPDMLEALQGLVSFFDKTGFTTEFLKPARAAISKATGHHPASQEREPSATSHAATSPGPVNCNIRLRFQASEGTPIGKSCSRCGLGPCPFFHETGAAK